MHNYETQVLPANQIQKFIKWFDGSIGTDREINLDPGGKDSHMYVLCLELEPYEIRLCRAFELSLTTSDDEPHDLGGSGRRMVDPAPEHYYGHPDYHGQYVLSDAAGNYINYASTIGEAERLADLGIDDEGNVPAIGKWTGTHYEF